MRHATPYRRRPCVVSTLVCFTRTLPPRPPPPRIPFHLIKILLLARLFLRYSRQPLASPGRRIYSCNKPIQPSPRARVPVEPVQLKDRHIFWTPSGARHCCAGPIARTVHKRARRDSASSHAALTCLPTAREHKLEIKPLRRTCRERRHRTATGAGPRRISYRTRGMQKEQCAE
ncbi:hypothetical protein HYPSUDRAFT_599234 [Hypholoma sublateritium FD-334 SS-4]|uniref:Uncharacterized protein n=1 Tax=Hypholoma sublateritium (strain FD-334 SS-4) TaxID=945553 RepID=A0A0D2P2U0_HYPSF|nr:hypothetical protein HYPSUDRAFT_599234 [Hypholoma sublateritium FD-334 SS-4]